MRGKKVNQDRVREMTRRPASNDTVFLSALAGTGDETGRAVIRNDVYLQALEAAKRVLRIYHSERRRQL
jgi:Ser/Thr protein kinase RdoA (MazF antagonist)